MPEGIYLTAPCFEGCGQAGGLWLLDPTTGSLQDVVPLPAASPQRTWALTWIIGSGAAWGIAGTSDSGNPDHLIRHDLSSGSVATWFSKSGLDDMWLMGFDSHGPIVGTRSGDESDVWLITATNRARMLLSTNLLDVASTALGDTNGIWLGGAGGLYLWSGGQSTLIVKAAAFPVGDCEGPVRD